jgi:hypothetical protein
MDRSLAMASVDLPLEVQLPGGIGLRAAELPFKDIPTTWVMDVNQEALPTPVPAASLPSAKGRIASPKGFWNDLPPEEEEVLFSFPSPTDYDREALRKRNTSVLNVREMMLMLVGIYLVMMLSHLVLLIIKS